MTYPATILGDSPRRYWRMNETSGTTMTDSSVNAVNGSYVGALTVDSIALIANPADPSVSFPGSSSAYALCQSGFVLGGLANATVEAWVDTSATPPASGSPIYCERAASGNDIWKFELMSSGGAAALRFTYRDDAGTLTQISTGTAIGSGAHYVAMTKTGTTIVLYLDGAAYGSPATLAGTDNFTNSTPSCRIGGDLADSSADYTGNIGEVALYNVALTSTQIAAHFNAASGGATPNPQIASGFFAA